MTIHIGKGEPFSFPGSPAFVWKSAAADLVGEVLRKLGKLDSKIAVITGAASGMALATAKLFVEEGAYVYITGRNPQRLDAAVKAIGRNATGVSGDSANLQDLVRLSLKR